LFLILLCPSLHGGMHNERAICIVALKKNLHKGVVANETVFQMYNNVHIILGKTEQKVSFILYNSLHLYKTSSKVISLILISGTEAKECFFLKMKNGNANILELMYASQITQSSVSTHLGYDFTTVMDYSLNIKEL
ncbi:hypothetical protein T4C_9414, partial [Trichinella pseudospiralis]